jgi:hypothetical protein
MQETRTSDIIRKMNLGTSKQVLSAEDNSPMEILLIGLHQEIINRLKTSLDKYDISASNRLKQSMLTVDESSPGAVGVAISANFYWKYVNYGVNGALVNRGAPTWGSAPAGTPSFHDAILGWIKDKGLKAKPGQTYDEMASAIMRGLYNKGQAPRPFFTDVVNAELKKYLTKSISDTMKQAITITIKDPWQ